MAVMTEEYFASDSLWLLPFIYRMAPHWATGYKILHLAHCLSHYHYSKRVLSHSTTCKVLWHRSVLLSVCAYKYEVKLLCVGQNIKQCDWPYLSVSLCNCKWVPAVHPYPPTVQCWAVGFPLVVYLDCYSKAKVVGSSEVFVCQCHCVL